ncbi:MAG: hypothetical protein M5R38_13215 [Candidatus Methylomirabilis sp.]|nr:hypothetical protein [Candidatus Methylomirabilis sp.]
MPIWCGPSIADHGLPNAPRIGWPSWRWISTVFNCAISPLWPRPSPVCIRSRGVVRDGRLPVYLPSRSLLRWDPFTPSWGVTSDSIAAYIAGLVKADTLLLLKSVDGLFAQDPKANLSAPLLPSITRVQLQRYGGVDREFGGWLNGIACCWIINGTHPARVKEWLECRRTVGTCVVMRQ